MNQVNLNENQIFLIQSAYRNHKQKEKYQNKVKVYYTSITGQSHKIRQNQKRADLLLEMKGWFLNKIDIVENTVGSQFSQQYRQKGYELPLIFINNNFIGGADELQELEDSQFLDDIYGEFYLQRCLLCDMDRQGNSIECQECGKQFTFFVKQ